MTAHGQGYVADHAWSKRGLAASAESGSIRLSLCARSGLAGGMPPRRIEHRITKLRSD
jgi:hypothetical protein